MNKANVDITYSLTGALEELERLRVAVCRFLNDYDSEIDHHWQWKNHPLCWYVKSKEHLYRQIGYYGDEYVTDWVKLKAAIRGFQDFVIVIMQDGDFNDRNYHPRCVSAQISSWTRKRIVSVIRQRAKQIMQLCGVSSTTTRV